jgi:nitrile hydratase accessory protein
MSELPDMPCDTEGPVFRTPWEALTFAMAVTLQQKGLFSWPEWANKLSDEIRAAQAAGDPDTGETYYQHWLRALEHIVVEKGAVTPEQLAERAAAWDYAARHTPHGQPIVPPA